MTKIDLNTVKVAFSLFFICFLVACSTENINETENKDFNRAKENFRFTANHFDWIGQAHNLALENTFLELQKNEDVNLQKFLENELTMEVYGLDSESPDFEYLGESVDNGLNLISNGITSIDKVAEFKPKVQSYLSELESIILEGQNIKEKINLLDEKMYADLKLNNEDLYILYSATSIGKHSSEYWLANGQKWKENVKPPKGYAKSLTAKGKDCSWWQMTGPNSCVGQLLGQVVMGDIIGAISGAVMAIAVNLFIGPGQIAYAVAVLGSGVAGSVAGGLNWIFN